ncbi:MAG: PAS domain-containing protein, partial [Pseudomonadota bacterium]
MFRDPPDWLRDATDPAMAWDVGGSRPLWANGPALALWGDRTLPEFLSRRFEPDDTFAAAVRTAAAAPAAAAAAIVFAPRGRPLRAELSVRPISARAGAPAAEAVAVILRPSAPSAPETRAARAEALFETAPSALAQLAADGRVLRENAAARRLFGPARAEGFAERFRDARAVGDAMTAAALHGAFEHGAVAASDGGRLRVVYRRFDDPVAQAETLVAHAAPAPMAETVAAEPTLDALTAGAALFDAGTLRLVSANAAARGWWAPKPAEAGADGAADATLFSLAPRAAPEIAAALAALKANPAAAPSFDVRPRAPSAPFAPTPWLRATLTLARLGGRRMLVATLQDLGPE